MEREITEVIKKSGERVRFSKEKLQNSLFRSGANEKTVNQIMDQVRDKLYQGIPTEQIYEHAMAMLLKKERHYAAKYSLKKAIYELGPTGFPFEYFISALLLESGYDTQVGVNIQGLCVRHEVDVLAKKGNEHTLVECKFHSEEGLHCNVKVPLYIHARYNDIKEHWLREHTHESILTPGWVVTNTRFTDDAQRYGLCAGLYLLSWDFPEQFSLKERIDRSGLYPITVSTLLTQEEKQGLISRDIVLCKQLLAQDSVLKELGVTLNRGHRVVDEMNRLCLNTTDDKRG
jgi:hypothetical protein